MRSEIVGSSGESTTVNEAVEGFSVFLASRISHSICASQVSSYVLRPVHDLMKIKVGRGKLVVLSALYGWQH
jgi:hypothetical protein